MPDHIEGYIEIGTNQTYEVVMNLGSDRTGHVVFSPGQAKALAKSLMTKAVEAEIAAGNAPAPPSPLPAGPTLRPACQIQMAHDVLAAVILNEVPADLTAEQRKMFHACLDAFCWVLTHEHNQTFANNLHALMTEIESKGLKLSFEPGGFNHA